jgi:hypothetical protein
MQKPSNKNAFDQFIILSKPTVRSCELFLNFLKITDNYLHTFNASYTTSHFLFKKHITGCFSFPCYLLRKSRKVFAIHNPKISNSFFFISIVHPNFTNSLRFQSTGGTFKNSFFLMHVTNEFELSQIIQSWTNLILEAENTIIDKFTFTLFININLMITYS